MAETMSPEAQSRCDAADAAKEAHARGGTSGLISLVIDLWIEQDRYRRIARLDRDTEPCTVLPDSEEGGL